MSPGPGDAVVEGEPLAARSSSWFFSRMPLSSLTPSGSTSATATWISFRRPQWAQPRPHPHARAVLCCSLATPMWDRFVAPLCYTPIGCLTSMWMTCVSSWSS